MLLGSLLCARHQLEFRRGFARVFGSFCHQGIDNLDERRLSLEYTGWGGQWLDNKRGFWEHPPWHLKPPLPLSPSPMSETAGSSGERIPSRGVFCSSPLLTGFMTPPYAGISHRMKFKRFTFHSVKRTLKIPFSCTSACLSSLIAYFLLFVPET